MKILFNILVVCFFSIPSVVHACSCGTGDPPIEFNRAKSVFIGRMIGGTEKFSTTDSAGKSRPVEAGAVRFAVQELFKGSLGNEVSLRIDSMRGTSCGDYGLTRGEVYLVYAYENESNKAELYTGVCTRTSAVTNKYVAEDLTFLRSMPAAGSGGNLRGRIWVDARNAKGGGAEPLRNVKIRVRGVDGTTKIVTSNENGEFELARIKAGKYRVEPEVPDTYYLEEDFEDVEVADRGTASVGLEVYFAGEVSGRLVDKVGAGYDFAFLHFNSTNGAKQVYGHSDGGNGAFSVDGVPPGEYILFLELSHEDSDKNKNYYYPGTFDRSEAKPVTVGLKGKVTGLSFVLPEEYQVRTIEGRVFWKNGKPAGGVEVNLLCPRSTKPGGFAIEFGAQSTESDETGRFRIQGFTGETYWIEARGEGSDGAFHSPSKRAVITDNIANLKLVLSEKGSFGSGCR